MVKDMSEKYGVCYLSSAILSTGGKKLSKSFFVFVFKCVRFRLHMLCHVTESKLYRLLFTVAFDYPYISLRLSLLPTGLASTQRQSYGWINPEVGFM